MERGGIEILFVTPHGRIVLVGTQDGFVFFESLDYERQRKIIICSKEEINKKIIEYQKTKEGCDISESVYLTIEELHQQIEMQDIILGSNIISILPRIERLIEEHFKREN